MFSDKTTDDSTLAELIDSFWNLSVGEVIQRRVEFAGTQELINFS